MDGRRLREQTRAEHEATEAHMPLMGEGLQLAVYVKTLEALYPLVLSWESWAQHRAPAHLQAMLLARRRSSLLGDDLRELGGVVHEERQLPWNDLLGDSSVDAASPGSEAVFLGALYVMEGSTLGGRFIARHVEAVLGLAPGRGDSYFRGHEDATGQMWKQVLAQIATIPESLEEVTVSSAKATFRIFAAALQAGLRGEELPEELTRADALASYPE